MEIRGWRKCRGRVIITPDVRLTFFDQAALRFMIRNIVSWIAALQCAAFGIACSYFVSNASEIFGGGRVPRATQVILFFGPMGWLLFFLFGALLVIRFRGSRMGGIIAICFLWMAIAIGCTLIFTPVSYQCFTEIP